MDIDEIKNGLSTALGAPLNELGTNCPELKKFKNKVGDNCFESIVQDQNRNKTLYVFVVISIILQKGTRIQGLVGQDDESVYQLYPFCKENNKKFFILVKDSRTTKLNDDAYIFVEIPGKLDKYKKGTTKSFQVYKSNETEAVREQRPVVYSYDDYYVAYVPAKDASGAATTEILKQYLFSYDSRPNSKYVVNTVDHQFVNYNPAPQPDTSDWPKNFIIAGAPGTGKSYMLNQKAEEKAIEQLVECAKNSSDAKAQDLAKTSSDAKAKDLADTYESVQHLYHTINEIICLKNKKDSEDKENGEYDANDTDITTKIGEYNQSYDEIKDKINDLSLDDPDEDADNNYKNELAEIKKKLEEIKNTDLHIKDDEEGSLKEKSDDIKDLGGIIVERIIEKALKISPKCYDKYKNTIRRVTFYEDYAYENFVGCYKPEPTEAENEYNLSVNGSGNYSVSGKSKTHQVTYKYMPGPFLETYIDAKNDPHHEYILIIEEINRAKAASVFGDVFQLLDRAFW